jgi:hypothetical protein
MRESIMMKEIRKAKDDLSEKAKKMSKEEFLKFIKEEAEIAKNMEDNSMTVK